MSESGDDGPGTREVAYRVFAAEFEDSDRSYSESDEERAPNYVVTPTGARVNRLFAVGVLTEVERVSDDVLRGRIVDPTGAFVVYAGQYQPDEQAFLDRAEPPVFVALTGKARTFQPEDSDVVYSSVRPESISEVDSDTRDRWVVTTAEHTLDRVREMAAAKRTGLAGEDLAATLHDRELQEGIAEGVPLALDHYGTTGDYLAAVRELALDAARVVAGERDEVAGLSLGPGEGDDAGLADLAGDVPETTGAAAESAETTPEAGTTTASEPSGTTEPATGGTAAGDAEPGAAGTDTDAGATDETAGDASTEAGSDAPDTGTVGEAGTTDGSPAGEATRAEVGESPEPASGAADAESSATATSTETDAAAGTVAPDAGADDEDVGDFEPGEFELDEEEREEIESEFGTDFQSGTEVDEPGEAGIETPDPDPEAGADPVAGEATAEPGDGATGELSATGPDPEPAGSEAGAASPAEEASAPESEGATDEGAAPDADGAAETPDDLAAAAVEVMGELDDGDGAERSAVVETMTGRYAVEAEAVEDAIQDALMSGQCYEPDDTHLKPI